MNIDSVVRHRIAAAAVTVCLLGVTTSVELVATGESANAIGTTHRLAAPVVRNASSVEGAAHVTFSCNDATGKWTVKYTGIQVITDDHVTTWTNYGMNFKLYVNPVFISPDVALTQNTTNGLFGATMTGTFDKTALTSGVCATGVSFSSADLDLSSHLGFSTTLT